MSHWFERFVALVFFLLPWQAVWIFRDDPSPYVRLGLYATDVLMVIAAGWSLWQNNSWRTSWKSWVAPVAAFIFFAAVALTSTVSSWKLGSVLVIAVFAFAVRRIEKRDMVVSAVLASAVLQSVLALGQFFSQSVFSSSWLGMSAQHADVLGASVVETSDGRWLRAYGTFPHPNILGGFLAMALLLAASRYFTLYEEFQQWWNTQGAGMKNVWGESVVRRMSVRVVGALAAFAIIVAGLLTTFSRSAALAAAIGLAVYLLMKRGENKIRATVLGVKLLLTLVGIVYMWQTLVPGVWETRTSTATRLEQRSASERVTGYQEAMSVLQAQPFLGVGLQQYTVAAPRIIGADQEYFQPVHNIWLLILSEIGLAGLAVIVVLFWKQLLRAGRYLLTQAKALPLALAVCFFVLSILDHYLWSLHAGMILWLIPFGL